MESQVVLGINIAAIGVMLICMYLVYLLRSKIPGGVVGKQWGLLTFMVTVFTAGYFVTPFFTQLPPNIINMFVALIFLFGAVYVLITVRLIFRVIEELV
jgi:hypothetical protein